MSTHLGWSSKVYPLEAADLLKLADYAGEPIPRASLPDDGIVIYMCPKGPDRLLRGRAQVEAAVADRGEDAVVPVRIVFVPSIAPWNILATYVRVLRNRHRYHGTGLYHIAPTTVREMGLERVQRTLDNPQKRKGKDRARDMLRLVESMRTRGFDDSRPICVQLCRTGGRVDFLHQGHHRVAACLACGIKRMAVCFSAAGVWPHLLGGSGR